LSGTRVVVRLISLRERLQGEKEIFRGSDNGVDVPGLLGKFKGHLDSCRNKGRRASSVDRQLRSVLLFGNRGAHRGAHRGAGIRVLQLNVRLESGFCSVCLLTEQEGTGIRSLNLSSSSTLAFSWGQHVINIWSNFSTEFGVKHPHVCWLM